MTEKISVYALSEFTNTAYALSEFTNLFVDDLLSLEPLNQVPLFVTAQQLNSSSPFT